jgi:hypothetical protein
MHTNLNFRAGCFAALLVSSSVAHALQYDLVTNSSQTVAGSIPANAIFDKGSLQTSGTGAIDPFLRLHHDGNSNSEKGFNTSSPFNPPDGMNAINGVFTHDLLLSTLATVNRGGVDYVQFNLDLGQSGNNGAPSTNLLLTTFNIYTGNTVSPTFAGIGGDPANLGTLRFTLNGNTVMLLDESSGNGASDVFIFVPRSAFTNVSDTYLYLYAGFGEGLTPPSGNPSPRGGTNGTFEEFSALVGPNNRVPDGGATVILLGLSLSGLAFARRKFVA